MKKNFIITILLSLFNICSAQSGWQKITVPLYAQSTTSFVNINTGYTLSSKIFKTTDGGVTWEPKTSSVASSDHDYFLYFPHHDTGYFNNGSLYKTVNGGNNWSYINPPFYYSNFPKTFFLNSNTGWIGDDSCVYRTTNGGINFTRYTLRDTIDPPYCKGIKFFNANTGYYIGTYSIYKTTNGGESWNPLSNTSPLPNPVGAGIYASDFCNENTGVVFGFSNGARYVSRTTNAGVSWNGGSGLTTSLISKIKFISEQTGWMCGSNSALFKTTNSGENWVSYPLDTIYKLTNIDFIDVNTGWISTGRNKILRTTTGGAVFISQISSEVPGKFLLSQNYPNPFNPNTVINYDLRAAGFVTMKIYNSSGSEIKTLISEKQSAGSYSVNFNAEGLPSGVYYYKLSSGNLSETKKMILLK